MYSLEISNQDKEELTSYHVSVVALCHTSEVWCVRYVCHFWCSGLFIIFHLFVCYVPSVATTISYSKLNRATHVVIHMIYNSLHLVYLRITFRPKSEMNYPINQLLQALTLYMHM